MKRVVLDHKIILAHNLTGVQAKVLQDAVRSNRQLNSYFKNRDIWISNSKPKFEGDNNIFYVYVVDEDLQKFFIENPKFFVFELPE